LSNFELRGSQHNKSHYFPQWRKPIFIRVI